MPNVFNNLPKCSKNCTMLPNVSFAHRSIQVGRLSLSPRVVPRSSAAVQSQPAGTGKRSSGLLCQSKAPIQACMSTSAQNRWKEERAFGA